ncbi:hypothetical protein C8R44DRAFT_877496 [Mycena epipterygia]|nr:hypothetical protein C8R44DRAFT_877496 [Mycena epipterygia]
MPVGAYFIDDRDPGITYTPPNPLATTNNLIYYSNSLTDGTHTLVITSESAQALWTDYFLVTPGASSSGTSSSISRSTSASPTSASPSSLNSPSP